MRKTTMTAIWVCERIASIDNYGNTVSAYINPLKLEVNIQQDFTELEHAEFGSDISGMIKIRTKKPPRLKEGDAVYMAIPKIKESIIIDDITSSEALEYKNYGIGNYTVISIKSSYVNDKRSLNPTVIIAKKER